MILGEYSFNHADTVLAFIHSHDLDVKYIIDTHIHADHLTAGQYLRARLYYDKLVAAKKIDSTKTPLPTRYGELITAYGPGVKVDSASDVEPPLYVVGTGIPHVQSVLSEKIPQVKTQGSPNQFDAFVKDGDVLVLAKDKFEVSSRLDTIRLSTSLQYIFLDASLYVLRYHISISSPFHYGNLKYTYY